jgi:hypothetical protein
MALLRQSLWILGVESSNCRLDSTTKLCQDRSPVPVAYEGDVLISTVVIVILVYGQRLFCNIAANLRSLAIASTSSMGTSLEGRRFSQLSLPRRLRYDALATLGEAFGEVLNKHFYCCAFKTVVDSGKLLR